MQSIHLTYQQWMQVHPTFRSIINRVPHVACYDDGELILRRVTFERPARAAAARRACTAQLRLRIDQAEGA